MYEYALQPEHRTSIGDETVDETTVTYTGALSVNSGSKKGRVPKEKRIVYDETTKDVSILTKNDVIFYLIIRTSAVRTKTLVPKL